MYRTAADAMHKVPIEYIRDFAIQLLQLQDIDERRRINGGFDDAKLYTVAALALQIASLVRACEEMSGFPDRVAIVVDDLRSALKFQLTNVRLAKVLDKGWAGEHGPMSVMLLEQLGGKETSPVLCPVHGVGHHTMIECTGKQAMDLVPKASEVICYFDEVRDAIVSNDDLALANAATNFSCKARKFHMVLCISTHRIGQMADREAASMKRQRREETEAMRALLEPAPVELPLQLQPRLNFDRTFEEYNVSMMMHPAMAMGWGGYCDFGRGGSRSWRNGGGGRRGRGAGGGQRGRGRNAGAGRRGGAVV